MFNNYILLERNVIYAAVFYGMSHHSHLFKLSVFLCGASSNDTLMHCLLISQQLKLSVCTHKVHYLLKRLITFPLYYAVTLLYDSKWEMSNLAPTIKTKQLFLMSYDYNLLMHSVN